MKHKIDSCDLMIELLNFVGTQFNVNVQSIRTDNAPDLVESDMKKLFM